MPSKKNIVALTDEQRQTLEKITKTGKAPASKINRARILLKANVNQPGGGWTDKAISEALDISTRTIERVRERFVLEDLDKSINSRPRGGKPQKRLDNEAEANLLALIASSPPTGNRWTLRLLAEQMVKQGYVENISHESVRLLLKKLKLTIN